MTDPLSPSLTPPARRWTAARQAAFLRALKDTQSASEAARSVGMSRQSAYKLRRRLAGQPFDRAWQVAVASSGLADALAPDPSTRRCPVCGARVWNRPR